METSLCKKFKIKAGDQLHLINAPRDFFKKMGSQPEGVNSSATREPTQVHWFVKNVKEVEEQAEKIMSLVRDQVLLWIYFPKASSRMQTDLTRDKGWEAIENFDLRFINLVSFDETWSAFAMRKGSSEKTTATTVTGHFADFIDTVNRSVKIPDDLAVAFEKHDKLKEKFVKLPFTHQKEYVEWILSARRQNTRERRIQGTIEKLEKNLENPSAKLK